MRYPFRARNSFGVVVPILMALLGPAARGQSPPVTVVGPPGTYIGSASLAVPGPVPLAGTWSGPAGTYTITIPAGTVITQTATGITIAWSNPPAPPPAPPPTPPAPPSPSPSTTGPYFILFATDKTSALPITPAQVALATSPTIAAALKAIHPRNRWAAPIDVATPTIAGWAPTVRAAGLPCVLVIGTDAAGAGFKVEVIPRPVDEPSLVAEIRRLAGGGVPK